MDLPQQNFNVESESDDNDRIIISDPLLMKVY